MIEILSSGAPNVVQDLGRHGHLHLGVSRSGAMDAPALRWANALAGNPAPAAGIEIGVFPFRVRFLADTVFAVTGAAATSRLDGTAVPPWWSTHAAAGQTLVVEPPESGCRAYLAVQGGIDVPLCMGSRSTDLKSGFGGHLGRGLRRGDRLPLGTVAAAPYPRAPSIGAVPPERAAFHEALRGGVVPVRAVVAAEHAAFTAQAQALLGDAEWLVTNESNRMGYRLSGPLLERERPLELLSHGLLPGTVQVPPSGQPIVQLAEANTCGGYPKIATVFESDLWRIGQAPAGSRLRFSIGTVQEAVEALRAQELAFAALQRDLALASPAH